MTTRALVTPCYLAVVCFISFAVSATQATKKPDSESTIKFDGEMYTLKKKTSTDILARNEYRKTLSKRLTRIFA